MTISWPKNVFRNNRHRTHSYTRAIKKRNRSPGHFVILDVPAETLAEAADAWDSELALHPKR